MLALARPLRKLLMKPKIPQQPLCRQTKTSEKAAYSCHQRPTQAAGVGAQAAFLHGGPRRERLGRPAGPSPPRGRCDVAPVLHIRCSFQNIFCFSAISAIYIQIVTAPIFISKIQKIIQRNNNRS